MKIAVNTRLLIKGKMGGMGWFTFHTLKHIIRQHPEHEFIFLFDRPYHPDFVFEKNIRPVILFPPARHPFLWYIWFQIRVKTFLKKEKPDLFLSPDGFLPLDLQIPVLSVIHDINFHHFPNNLPFFVRKYYLRYFHLFAENATRIATVSEYSKADITKSFNIAPEKIDVVYNGADAIFHPVNAQEQEEVRKKITEGASFFVYLGSLIPRKNLTRLLKAFDTYKKKSGSLHKLVIIGDPLFRFCRARETHRTMKFKDEVIFTGRIPRDQINEVIGSATALMFVPYFEGFGIPILEAFRCHTAVVAGDRTSLPEVAGDAALYVDPFSVESIAEGMEQIATKKALREKLIHKGSLRWKEFTWEKTAGLLWESVEKTLDREK